MSNSAEREKAMQALADQAQELDMGYGAPAARSGTVEREAIAQIIRDRWISPWETNPAEHAADLIIAEHIEPIRAALEIAEAKLLSDELHPSDLERKLFARASALEALLAECEEALYRSLPDKPSLDIDTLQALLAKLKGRRPA